MYTHLIHGPLGPPESTSQTAFRSAHPFLQGSRHIFTIFHSGPGDAPHKKTGFPLGDPTPPPTRAWTWLLGGSSVPCGSRSRHGSSDPLGSTAKRLLPVVTRCFLWCPQGWLATRLTALSRSWWRLGGNLLLRPSVSTHSTPPNVAYSCSTHFWIDLYLWPWPMTSTFNPRRAVVMTNATLQIKIKNQLVQKRYNGNERTDGHDRSHYLSH